MSDLPSCESDDPSTWSDMVAGLEIESEDNDLRLQLFGHNGIFLTAGGIIVADVVGAGILAIAFCIGYEVGLYPGIEGAPSPVGCQCSHFRGHVASSDVFRMFCPTCIGTRTYTGFVRGAFAKAPGNEV